MPSKSELKSLGERRNYQDRELDARAVSSLSSDEYLWFQTFFPARLETAAQREANKKHNQAAMKQVGAQQFWNKHWRKENQAPPEEANRILAELQKFQATFPQFIVSRAENEVVLQWLKDNDLALNYRNLVESFEANALEGKVWLNPNAINAGSETEVSGQQLLQHHNFFKLIQQQQRMSETDRLSADDYLAQNPQLRNKAIPPIVASRLAKKAATEKFFAEARAGTATARAGATRVTDYPSEQRGWPPEPDKYSFKQKVRSMSASEIAQRCADDPAFKKSLDELK